MEFEREMLSDRVIRFIATREHKEFAALTVSKLAREFKVDRFKLSRRFKSEKEMTLEVYLMQEKMFRCAYLLTSEADITIKEVSDLMGFCTCDYFIQVFKKNFGVLPGQYKEYKNQRSGVADRRMGLTDRRTNPTGKPPKGGDRRKGLTDRRQGTKDRRK